MRYRKGVHTMGSRSVSPADRADPALPMFDSSTVACCCHKPARFGMHSMITAARHAGTHQRPCLAQVGRHERSILARMQRAAAVTYVVAALPWPAVALAEQSTGAHAALQWGLQPWWQPRALVERHPLEHRGRLQC